MWVPNDGRCLNIAPHYSQWKMRAAVAQMEPHTRVGGNAGGARGSGSVVRSRFL